jgi:glycogen operon protein
MADMNERGEPITDDTLLVLLNAEPGAVPFVVPDPHPGLRWEVVVDTAEEGTPAKPRLLDAGAVLTLTGRSLALLRGYED